jgi:FKBP-type peptidyl-prolyl cis-trans isomerase
MVAVYRFGRYSGFSMPDSLRDTREAVFLVDMNTRNIVIWVIVLIVVLLGGYATYKFMSGGSASPATAQQNATSTPTAGDQVQAQEVKVGTGAEATPGATVSVLYVGKLTDGTVFDSSAAHDNQPLTFVLGSQDMIPGFQIGVNGMKVGGQRVMAVPPTLAYGDKPVTNPQTGATIIPANSTIVFEVQLVDVKAPANQ